MKRFSQYLLLFIATMICTSTFAQKKRIYLLNDFTQGTVLMNNRSKASALLNYDTSNRTMMYKEDNTTMILTNTQSIDTVFIGSHKFIPAGRIFLEVVRVDNGLVYINWLQKEKYQGQKGAYGQTTQNTVTTINTNHFQPGRDYEKQSSDVFSLLNENEYWIFKNEKPIKFKDKKSLLKQFPEKAENLDNFIKENKTDFKNVNDALKIANYCLHF